LPSVLALGLRAGRKKRAAQDAAMVDGLA